MIYHWLAFPIPYISHNTTNREQQTEETNNVKINTIFANKLMKMTSNHMSTLSLIYILLLEVIRKQTLSNI